MIYDYICPSCKKEKEVSHSIKDSPEILCSCGKKMKIRIDRNYGGVIFNGTGFTKKSV